MERMADCNIIGFHKGQNGVVDVELKPMGQGFCVGNWTIAELDKTYTWQFDPRSGNVLELLDLYFDYKLHALKLSAFQAHSYFKFDKNNTVLGIV